MDPLNRRSVSDSSAVRPLGLSSLSDVRVRDFVPRASSHVWAFIEKFKRNRVIVLTTHSMEEADILGDQIAIMALGKLR